MSNISALTDSVLIENLRKLVAREGEASIGVLKYLIEVEERRLYLNEGYPSLFAFCTTALQYSEPSANRRIRAARLLKRFPEIESLLKERKLSLAGLSLLYSVITKENATSIFNEAIGKSYRATEAIAARFKDPLVRGTRDTITPIHVVKKEASALFLQQQTHDENNEHDSKISSGADGDFQNTVPKNIVKPPPSTIENQVNTIERVRITFAADKDFLQMVEAAKILLSGKYPKGISMEDIFAEALEVLIDKKSPEKRLERRKSKPAREVNDPTPKRTIKLTTRHIPLILRDEIFKRDGGCCSFVSPSGQRCGSKWDIEIDHVQPFIMGGDHSYENLRLLCRAHNAARNSDEFGLS